MQKRGAGKLKLLDSDGLCAVGESIENGDYFINKQSPTNTKDLFPMGAGNVLPDNMYKATPMSYKGAKGENSIVDKVLLTQNDENEEIIKVCPTPWNATRTMHCDVLDLYCGGQRHLAV